MTFTLTIGDRRGKVVCTLANLTDQPLRIRKFHPKADLKIRSTEGHVAKYYRSSSFGYLIERQTLGPHDAVACDLDLFEKFRFPETELYTIEGRYDSHRFTSRLCSYSDLDHVIVLSNRIQFHVFPDEVVRQQPFPCDVKKFRDFLDRNPEIRDRVVQSHRRQRLESDFSDE